MIAYIVSKTLIVKRAYPISRLRDRMLRFFITVLDGIIQSVKAKKERYT